MNKPSHYASLGVPCLSIWGKSEYEEVAYVYVLCLSRNGDSWDQITPTRTFELLSEPERRKYNWMGRLLKGNEILKSRWEQVTSQITNSDDAEKISTCWKKIG